MNSEQCECGDPECNLHLIRSGKEPCKNCNAGIVVRLGNLEGDDRFFVEACPVCQRFEEDSDAANAVTKLLELLAKAPGATVADKLDSLSEARTGCVITTNTLEDAPLYTVLNAMGSKVESRACVWDFFDIGGAAPSEEITDKMHALGYRYVEDVGIHPEVDSEANEGKGVDDLDAAVCALASGRTLMKLPDYPLSKYSRWYAVEKIEAAS